MFRLHDTLRQSLAAAVSKRFGDVSRLSDYELARLAERLQDRRFLLDLRDLQTLSAFSRTPWAERPESDIDRLEVILREVEHLDFAPKADRGVLYSGAYCLSSEPQLRMGSFNFDTEVSGEEKRFTGNTSGGAYQYANSRSKTVIEMTSGGHWIKQNEDELRKLGGGLVDLVWAYASGKFVQALAGQVDVFLSYPLFEKTYRIAETLLLFKNQRVTRITYYLEHGSVRKEMLPAELSGPGVAKTVTKRNKTLVFRLSSGKVE
ncbi:MAG: hypothetical protein JNN08_28595 [Bryobacterales bacterium]|nr:hypothetical protein [Bryobacterales bacterium]